MPRESSHVDGDERAAAAESRRRCGRLEEQLRQALVDLEDEKRARHAQAQQLRVAEERVEAANMVRRAAVRRLDALEEVMSAPAAKRRTPTFSLPRRQSSRPGHRVVPESDEEAPPAPAKKRARPATSDDNFEEHVVRFVQDWGDQMLAGNPLMLHEARLLEEGQVKVALQATRDGARHRRGDGALEDALLRAVQNGHLGMVTHHIRDAECRECLREVLADIPEDQVVSSSDDDEEEKGEEQLVDRGGE